MVLGLAIVINIGFLTKKSRTVCRTVFSGSGVKSGKTGMYGHNIWDAWKP